MNLDSYKLATPPEGKEIGLCMIHNKWLNDDGECTLCIKDKELNDIRLFDMIIEMWHRAIALHELAEDGKHPIYTEYFDGAKRRQKDIVKYRAIRNYLSNKIDYYEPKN